MRVCLPSRILLGMQHIGKFDQWGWASFERRFFDPERIAGLQGLQRSLLGRGFALLVSQSVELV